MVDPALMCRQHLLGEHYEIHKMLGSLRGDGKWARRLTDRGFLEPQNTVRRHDKIAKEMVNRGYNHNSPIIIDVDLPLGNVDVEKSLRDLAERCGDCRARLT